MPSSYATCTTERGTATVIVLNHMDLLQVMLDRMIPLFSKSVQPKTA
jgi:hypothetical protein